MLDPQAKSQLATYLERLVQPIELSAALDDSPKSATMRELLDDIAALSDKVSVVDEANAEIRPSFGVARAGETARVRFAGIPMGHEFSSLVLALLQVSGYPPKIDDDVVAQIQGLSEPLRFETFISLSCHNCPEVVQSLNTLAVLNPNISHTMIDGADFQDEVKARNVMAVPMVFLNGEQFGQGRMTIEEIVAKLDAGASEQAAQKLNAKEPFDVLVVGGGPAGAAAAIYAARKGIRTGVVAERFGGQVLDTLAIENLISVPETEGPKLAQALEQHVKVYPVDIMNVQKASRLTATDEAGYFGVGLDNGATLKAKSVILATGARWRNMNVPGEAEYRNKGVAYCPHCDGPLFKDKRVAVIGGGNSGVEAAIDLAGIVAHVTLFEFDDKLRADAVLQAKLRSLSNVTVHTSALTTEVLGDGSKVTGLRYKNRTTDEQHEVELEGIFVQIGLLPNTDWLKDTLQLSQRGEIEIDAHGQTSLAGVFAAGDCTTVPYKQIIISMGAGATAALGAFDHLIRSSV